jgi:hypothetical protein
MTLEEWKDFPFGNSYKATKLILLIDEEKEEEEEEEVYKDSLGAFDSNGNFFIYSHKAKQKELKLYI